MVVLRCTRKLLTRLNQTAAAPGVESTTRLGDWYGNAFRLGPQQLLMFISEHSRLAVVIPAKGCGRLSQLLPDAIAERLADLGMPLADIDDERARMSAVAFGPTRSRSLLGTMNDYIAMVHYGYRQRGVLESPAELMRFLAQTPILPLDGASPIELTQAAFGVSQSATRRRVDIAEFATSRARQPRENCDASIIDFSNRAQTLAIPRWRTVRNAAGMAEISRFYGIVIRMYVETGAPRHRPHFHAYYQDASMVVAIDNLDVLGGELPIPQRRLVEAWGELHRAELLQDWTLLQSGNAPVKIDPLR